MATRVRRRKTRDGGPIARARQRRHQAQKLAARPPWDSTVRDHSVFRATKEEVLLGSAYTRQHIDEVTSLLDAMGADSAVLKADGMTFHFERSQYGRRTLNIHSRGGDDDDGYEGFGEVEGFGDAGGEGDEGGGEGGGEGGEGGVPLEELPYAAQNVMVPPGGENPVADADLIGAMDGDQLLINVDRLPLQLEGRHNARNLLLAVAVADQLGVPRKALEVMQVTVPGGRNRRLKQGGLTLLDETYNASPEAVLAALELLAAQPGRRFAVLGTMLELGDHSLELHREVAARALQLGLDGLVLVDRGEEGKAMAEVAASLPNLQLVSKPEAAALPLAKWLRSGDVLLLKASRGIALERLIPLLPRF